MTKKGDLLVSTVRPYRGAVSITSFDDLLVSGAFTVLRSKGVYPVQTLQVLFRIDLYKEWLLKFNVGTQYPVIKDDDILDIPIPKFDVTIHKTIEESINKVRLLLKQSEKTFDYAKQAMEIAIEKDEEAAIIFLDSLQ
jgi:type I restriction enzyme S subunit